MSDAADFELQMDLSADDIRAWGGESGPVLPPGVYDFELTAVDQDQAKSTGNPVIKIEFTVLNEGEHYGKTLKKSYSLQQKALGRLKNLMMACGARLDGVRRSELINKRITADISLRTGDPQPQPDGTMKEGGTFSEIQNERMFDDGTEPEAETQPEPAPAPAPAAKPAATASASNGKASAPPPQTAKAAVRRAVGQAKQ